MAMPTRMPSRMDSQPRLWRKKPAAKQEEMDTIAPRDMSTPRPSSIAMVIPSAMISSMED